MIVKTKHLLVALAARTARWPADAAPNRLNKRSITLRTILAAFSLALCANAQRDECFQGLQTGTAQRLHRQDRPGDGGAEVRDTAA